MGPYLNGGLGALLAAPPTLQHHGLRRLSVGESHKLIAELVADHLPHDLLRRRSSVNLGVLQQNLSDHLTFL